MGATCTSFERTGPNFPHQIFTECKRGRETVQKDGERERRQNSQRDKAGTCKRGRKGQGVSGTGLKTTSIGIRHADI